MIKYFIYCRKSSEDEERQILSIEAQLAELREFAKQNNLFVVKEYYESKTAKEPGREVFNFMLSEIEKGNAEGILAWNPDRLARNSIDGGRIIYLVDTGKITSLKFPTFWFEPTPQGKFMLSVAFGQAKYYTDNLRENILRGIRQKIRRGELSAKAPLGYFNEPRLRTIEPDKKTFNKVKEILRAFATCEYTLTKIQSKMFSLGLVGKDGKLPHLSTIQKILTNPFYYGHFRYRGEVHQGSHKPMISKKLFDKIQEALILNGKPRKKRGPKNFQFLNFAVCGECGYSITAERKIKKSGLKYHYYHCTFKSKTQNCSQTRFLREEALTEQVKENCQKVSLPDDWREKYLEKVNLWEKENSQSSNLFAQNLKTELSAIKEKLERLTDAYLAEALELAEYQERKNALMAKKKDIEEKLSDFERKGNHWLELTRNWIIEANQAKNFVLDNNFSEMKNFIKKIGSNRRILNQRLCVDYKKPWNYLYFLPAESRAKGAGEAKVLRNRLMWCYSSICSNFFRPRMNRPATASQSLGNPERKNTPCISELAGVKFLLKKERVFFFRGSAQEVSGQCVGLQYGLGKNLATASFENKNYSTGTMPRPDCRTSVEPPKKRQIYSPLVIEPNLILVGVYLVLLCEYFLSLD